MRLAGAHGAGERGIGIVDSRMRVESPNAMRRVSKDVRFESKADLTPSLRLGPLYPRSGHRELASICPFSARRRRSALPGTGLGWQGQVSFIASSIRKSARSIVGL